MGRETLSSNTPGGSNNLNASMVEIYCVIMTKVSAPGCNRRVAHLQSKLINPGAVRLSKNIDELGSCSSTSQTHLEILNRRCRLWKLLDNIKQLINPKINPPQVVEEWYRNSINAFDAIVFNMSSPTLPLSAPAPRIYFNRSASPFSTQSVRIPV